MEQINEGLGYRQELERHDTQTGKISDWMARSDIVAGRIQTG